MLRVSKSLVIAGLVVYFLYLVLSRIPASIVVWGVHKAAPNVWLMGESGTLWKGVASSAQVNMGREPVALGQVRWTLSPLSLLTLKPCIDISTSTPGLNSEGKLCGGLSGVNLKDFTLDAPAELLQGLAKTALRGSVSLQVNKAKLKMVKAQPPVWVEQMTGQLSWQGSAVQFEGRWFNFGSLGAKLKEKEGGLQADIFDISGPYGIKMAVDALPGKAIKAAGTVTPRQDASPQVVEALQVIGEEKQGVFTVMWP